ncbi:MAG: hypothetical protein GXO74_05135 [Calditrichaeota bacterium]|nr:hypothetical protein [Calditrichota bacterium]
MDQNEKGFINNRKRSRFIEYLRKSDGKPFRRIVERIGQVFFLFVLLYIFILSITMLGASFKLFGKGFAEQLLSTTSNPLVGLVIGILATSVIQSSSTTTSIVVGMVGVGALSISNAIPIIMGANIGTSVTNTIVSLGHISISEEFERAFSSAIVHDFFNIMAVLILFPLQYFTDFLGHSARFLADAFQHAGGLEAISPIKLVTKPVVHEVSHLSGDNGIILLVLALILLFISLRYITKVVKKLIIGRVEVFFDKVIFRNALISLLFGLILTSIVQSSSITTSLIVPLVGAGILTLEQIFPYTLGANIGTTVTAILASLATANIAAVTVAFAHLLFNVFGTIMIFPFQFVPIKLARTMAKLTLKSKLYPVFYILIVFFLIPFLIIFFLR